MLTATDIEFLERMQAEYDSLAQRWREASAYSQEVANLHATFKARDHVLGEKVIGGLFRRVLEHINAPGVPPVEVPSLSDGVIDKIWHDTPAQGDPTGKLFYRYFARAIEAHIRGVAAPGHQTFSPSGTPTRNPQ